MHFLKFFCIALVVFCVLDMIWLGYITKSLYFHYYKDWLNIENGRLQLIWWSALLVYGLLALAIVVFVLPLAGSSLILACAYGALMGAIIYGVYDFTCLAIFKNWPWAMAFVDWGWGTVICAASATCTVYFSK